METSDALTNFYETDYDAEKEEMREEIERLNNEIRLMEESGNEEEEQLALLEKSYQMASKYLPVNGSYEQSEKRSENTDDKPVFEVVPEYRTVVSSLVQQKSDDEFMAEYSGDRNLGFNTPTSQKTDAIKNTIACRVDRTTTIKDDEMLQLRLMESVRIANVLVPKNSLLTARSKLSGNRMMLFVSSIEVGENIYPVKLTAYDMDGQEGVFIPGSEEMDRYKLYIFFFGKRSNNCRCSQGTDAGNLKLYCQEDKDNQGYIQRWAQADADAVQIKEIIKLKFRNI